MLAAHQSSKALGIGLLATLLVGSVRGAESAQKAQNGLRAEARQVDLASHIHLVLGPTDASGRVDVCLGTAWALHGLDIATRAATVAALELRRESVARAVRDHFGEPSQSIRTLYILNGDVATTCIEVATPGTQAAVSALLESLKTPTLSDVTWSRVVQNWENHEGLAAQTGDEVLHRQLQSLMWLGTSVANASIVASIQQSLLLKPTQVVRAAPLRPQSIVVAALGEYSPSQLENQVRSNIRVQQLARAPARATQQTNVTLSPLRSPRFARERRTTSNGHLWLFGWPITHLDTPREAGFKVLARLLEQRLNEQAGVHETGYASCSVQSYRGYAAFVVEVRSKTLELDAVDRMVRSAVFHVREGQVNQVELAQAIEGVRVSETPPSTANLDEAWSLVARGFVGNGAAYGPKPLPHDAVEISRVAQVLDPNHIAEVFAEAVPVSSPAHVPSTASPRRGRVHVIQKGESLQTIARRFHVTVGEIIRENRLSHPDQIRPGTPIRVPLSSSPSPPPARPR